MSIAITKTNSYCVAPSALHEEYIVTFFNDAIFTCVTQSPSVVDEWISTLEYIHRRRLRRLVVGLDVEWRPNTYRGCNNPVAILQLCVGRRCLIFQLCRASYIPQSLKHFLRNSYYTFVGVGVYNDVYKLSNNYGLEVSNAVDLASLVDTMGIDLLNPGLKALAHEVLGVNFEKPRNITLSCWDIHWLSFAQVQYACIDAFVSFEIGRIWRAWEFVR